MDGLEDDLFFFVGSENNLNLVTYDLDLMVGHIDIKNEELKLWEPGPKGKF